MGFGKGSDRDLSDMDVRVGMGAGFVNLMFYDMEDSSRDAIFSLAGSLIGLEVDEGVQIFALIKDAKTGDVVSLTLETVSVEGEEIPEEELN